MEGERSYNPEVEDRKKREKQVHDLFVGDTRKIPDTARILGAQEFLEIIPGTKKGESTTFRFRMKEYVDALIQKEKSTGIHIQLPTAVETETAVVFPAGEGEMKTGGGTGVEQKREFQRNALLIELLSEHKIQYENPRISSTTSDMMRSEGYTIYFLPELEKTVCVNNEEGNTTIILFDTQSYDDAREIFTRYTKEQIRTERTAIAECIDWDSTYIDNPGLWKEKVYTSIMRTEPVPAATPAAPNDAENKTGADKKLNAAPEQNDFTKRIFQFEQAFAVWQALDKETRGKFNTMWLRNNGYNRLYDWAITHGEIESLVEACSEDLQKAFEKQEKILGRTIESARVELEQAFAVWQALDAKTRGKFNLNWLKKNGFDGLSQWAVKYDRIKDLIDQSSDEIKAVFEKREMTSETKESARVKLEQAFAVWQALDKETRGKFNTMWLRNNGYKKLYGWSKTHGGLESLVEACSEDLQKAFKKKLI